MYHLPHIPCAAFRRRHEHSARRQVVLQTDAAWKFDAEVSLLAVVADRERRANVEGALCCGSLFWRLRLLEKINVRFVVVIFDQIGCFIETNPAEITAGIDVPRTRNILGLFARFVRHNPFFY